MGDRILIISSDAALIERVRASLQGQECELASVPTGTVALQDLYTAGADLIILDGRTPSNLEIRNPSTSLRTGSKSEIEWVTLSHLRQVTDLPILMFVPAGQVARGLKQGADDCLSEPFLPEELTARVGALLRRARLPPTTGWLTRYMDDQVSINLEQRRVLVQGERVHLTPVEFRLLACLVGEAGRVVPHEKLIARVWGPEHVGKDHLLSPRIYKLRQKIEPDPAQPEYILTERGFGYRFKEPP